MKRSCAVIALLCISIFPLLLLPATAHADGFPIIAVLPNEGKSPEAIAVDTGTHMVYIAYENPGLVVAFDPVKEEVRWHVGIGDFSSDVQVDSITHRVFVASNNFPSSSNPTEKTASVLAILDGKTGKVLGTASVPVDGGFVDDNIAIDPQRQEVYMAGDQHGLVNVFHLTTATDGTISANVTALSVGPHPTSVGVNSRLGRLYVGDAAAHKITVINENTGTIVTTIQVASDPVPPLRVDEASGRVYVVCSAGQELDVINGNNNSVIAHVPVTPFPEGVAFNTATGRIYVADEGNRDNGNSNDDEGTTITVIDGKTFQVLGTMAVGHGPDGVEADPQLQRVYVATEDSNAMVEISDSVNLPLQSNTPQIQKGAIHQAVHFLQQATVITIILMLLTMAGATLGVLAPRWRARENPRTPPGAASSR